MKNKTAILLIQLSICVVLVGCQAAPVKPVFTATLKAATSAPLFELTNTAEVTSSATLLNAPTNVEPTLTETPGNIIPTLIRQLTLTPIPTLSESSREAKIQELLSTNGRCELPCFWGIVPGETTWEEAQEFLAPFANEIAFGDFAYVKEDGKMIPKATTGARFSVEGYPDDLTVNFLVSNGTITSILIAHDALKVRYSLDQLLTELGQPEEVLVYLEPKTPTGKPWYGFHLYYPAVGVWAIFEGEAEWSGSSIKYCPTTDAPSPTAVTPRLTFYPPGAYTLKEMIGIMFDPPGFVIPSLQEYAGITPEDFYIQLKESGSCFSVEYTGEPLNN